MSAHQYEKPADALKDLTDAYNYWSGKLTDSSVTFALGLIAANWAVFADKLRTEQFPRLSVAFALLTLLASAVTALVMSNLHDKRHAYAEADPERWIREFDAAKNCACRQANPWPYTQSIERVGYWSRWVRCLLPIASCVFFLISFDWTATASSKPAASCSSITSSPNTGKVEARVAWVCEAASQRSPG